MWALDLGTTNTLLARWDRTADRPVLLELPSLCRRPGNEDPLEAPRVVPSAVHVIDQPGWWARAGFGKLAHIGRAALELNQTRHRPNYAPTFKRELGTSPLRTLARAGGRSYSAREVARLFLRELLAAAKEASGERIRDLVITSPVEAFETYRAELVGIGKKLGIRRIRFLDEPVAAALGYGLGLSRKRNVLVVDFGGGTMHIALVALGPEQLQAGRSEVLAKAGRDVGGNLVDRWLLEDFCRRLGYQLDDPEDEDVRLWRRLMLAEACRVKEAVYFKEKATFEIAPPEKMRHFEARLRGEASSTLEVGRADLINILTERGLYQGMRECLDEVLTQARARGVGDDEIDEVLMVGGSTLLPDVYSLFEHRFGRGKVRAFQPFEAVAYGGAVFAAGKIEPADFIVHDYALLTYDLQSKKPEHTVIVPRGTRFPTRTDFWKRQLVPTCSLGEPERLFKLVVCEIGAADDRRKFVWDDGGRLHKVGGNSAEAQGPVVVKLNEASPTLGYLDPPQSPSDRNPRLEVSFGVNVERWLCATVFDLRTGKHLMRGEPVVRLL